MIIATKQDITTAMYALMEKANALLSAGKKLKVEISEFKETRSTAQNACTGCFALPWQSFWMTPD